MTAADAAGQIQGWLHGGGPDQSYRVDIYDTTVYLPGSSGAAQAWLGSLVVTTDASGRSTFAIPFKPSARRPAITATATATDLQGDTSGLSNGRQATLEAPVGVVRVAPGQSLAFSTGSGDAIAIQDPGCRSAGAGVVADALRAGREPEPGHDHRPEGDGRRDGLNVLQRHGRGPRRGPVGDDLHAGRRIPWCRQAQPGCPVDGHRLDPVPGADRGHDRSFPGHDDGGRRTRLAPPGHPRLQRDPRRDQHDRLRHPGEWPADHRSGHDAAGDHQSGRHRRHVAARILRHALDRGRRRSSWGISIRSRSARI